MAIFLLVIGLVLFVALVVVHEFGHFLVARRNAIDVEEFGIGFPPRAWSRRVGGAHQEAKTKNGADTKSVQSKQFVFSINWLPLGGFVKLKGEHDADTQPGTFGAAGIGAKARVMLAGVGMNFLAAFVLFTILAWAGMPQIIGNQFAIKSDTRVSQDQVLIGRVESHSPAQAAGLETRDRLVALGPSGHLAKVTTAAALPDITKKYAGQQIEVQYVRQGAEHTARVRLLTKQMVAASQNTASPKGYLGIAPTEFTLKRATWSAPVVALGLMWQFTAATFQGLGSAIGALFHGNTAQASAQVSGPVGIFVLLRDGSLLGYQFMLIIVAIISLTLAIMNVLPIPALDGGRLFMLLTARLFHKQLSQELEERLVGASFVFLMLLVGLITIVDVRRFF